MLSKQAAGRMRKQSREGKLAGRGGHPGQGAAAQCWDSFLFLAWVKETPLSLTQAALWSTTQKPPVIQLHRKYPPAALPRAGFLLKCLWSWREEGRSLLIPYPGLYPQSNCPCVIMYWMSLLPLEDEGADAHNRTRWMTPSG